MELIKDTKNRSLGLREHECRICGAKGMFQSYLVREMMKGTRDEFEYFVCPKCYCMQIGEVPENLGYYYGNDYYSMKVPGDSDTVFESPIIDDSKILDVGCGAGKWLYKEAQKGRVNLWGCDPFIEHDLKYGDRVHIKKCDISEMEGDGTYDVIRMADSFEHVTNPKEVLENANRLLSNDGMILMGIPIYPNIAFDLFETHWYQLDAPRHIFLHSLLSIKHLADESGLEITIANYDSEAAQIVYSYLYQHGVTYNEITEELILKCFKPEELLKMDETAKLANENKNGDHVRLQLQKRGDGC